MLKSGHAGIDVAGIPRRMMFSRSSWVGSAPLGVVRNLNFPVVKFLGDGRKFLCGNEYTIADAFAAGVLPIGDWIGQSFSAFPNVERWLKNVTSRPSWKTVEQDHKNLAGFFSAGSYAKIEGASSAG